MQRFSGRRAKAARILTGLSRVELAAKAGISEESVARFERGRHAPSGEILPLYADGLNVDVGYLFETVEEVA